MNKTETTAALCEVDLKNGKSGGVLAIGRCATCELAFCASHRANALRTDLCAPCVTQILAEASAPQEYFQSGQARTALLASGVPSVDMYWFQKRWELKKGFFGQSGRHVDVVIPLGRAWLLGEIGWRYTRESDYFAEENWLTALLEEPQDKEIAESILYWLNLGLYPVILCPGGYTLISHNAHLAGRNQESLKAAILAVKRLTGTSS